MVEWSKIDPESQDRLRAKADRKYATKIGRALFAFPFHLLIDPETDRQ